MKFMVPFDGSRLSEAALGKAKLHAIALEEAPAELVDLFRPGHDAIGVDVIAVSIVPESRDYARAKGWIAEGEEFSARRALEVLHRQVSAIAPNASFQFERVDAEAGAGTISSRLRRTAGEIDASDVFVGSENAGRIVTPLSSAGSGVAADERYDVTIVRRPLPPNVKQRLKSDFFL